MNEIVKPVPIIKSGKVWPVGGGQIIVSVFGVNIPTAVKVSAYYFCNVSLHSSKKVVFRSKGTMALQPPHKDILGRDIFDEVLFLFEGDLPVLKLIDLELKISNIGRMLNELEVEEKKLALSC